MHTLTKAHLKRYKHKKMRIQVFLLLLILMITGPLDAQPDPVFRHVDQVLWVVKNMKSTVKGWQELGFTDIENFQKITLTNRARGEEQLPVKAAVAHLDGLTAVWVQPGKGQSVFGQHLQLHGEGAFALIHQVENEAQLQQLLNNFAQKNIGKIATFTLHTPTGDLDYVLLDTMEKGKYFMGFVLSNRQPAKSITGKNQLLEMHFTQYAFAIKTPEPVSTFWAGAGLPEFKITHPENWDKQYFGMKADFDMKLGWQRHGDIVYEWCIPLTPPNVYADHIRRHGEGLQHFGFRVSDIDKAIDFFKARGYKISQSGGWGQKGKPGSGRFAYVDLDQIGGMTLELLWNYSESQN